MPTNFNIFKALSNALRNWEFGRGVTGAVTTSCAGNTRPSGCNKGEALQDASEMISVSCDPI